MGSITAQTWALEIGEFTRFGKIKEAISYCGLCGEVANPESAGINRHVVGGASPLQERK